jgi:hypothetical protein
MAKAAEMLGGRDPSFGVAPVIRTILSMVRFPPVLVMSRPARWMMLEIREASNATRRVLTYLHHVAQHSFPLPPLGKNDNNNSRHIPTPWASCATTKPAAGVVMKGPPRPRCWAAAASSAGAGSRRTG